MTDRQREPVDRDLLAETIRLFGMAVEYKGQVFNPAEVVVHTNGVTDAHRLSLVWAVVNRWTRPDCAPVTDEATQLLGEIREALSVRVLTLEGASRDAGLPPDVQTRIEALPDVKLTLSGIFPAPACTCECITELVRDPDEICAHPDCLFGEDPNCPVHGTAEVDP